MKKAGNGCHPFIRNAGYCNAVGLYMQFVDVSCNVTKRFRVLHKRHSNAASSPNVLRPAFQQEF
ncbi:hypothetical protein OUZ56_020700 [Daphnia magna]|uniref:Uncharacterized protein n=1 Tax=Daphnia magna TaxID=35525 RepID=A0ABQ9ZF77_9CRUS|nr:hypothetical protein OUZ56_020700 [Daphnia magna]